MHHLCRLAAFRRHLILVPLCRGFTRGVACVPGLRVFRRSVFDRFRKEVSSDSRLFPPRRVSGFNLDGSRRWFLNLDSCAVVEGPCFFPAPVPGGGGLSVVGRVGSGCLPADSVDLSFLSCRVAIFGLDGRSHSVSGNSSPPTVGVGNLTAIAVGRDLVILVSRQSLRSGEMSPNLGCQRF